MDRKFRFSRLSLPLLAAVCLLLAWKATLAGAGQSESGSIPAEVQQAVAEAGEARVLLLLETEPKGQVPSRAKVRRAQNTLLARLKPEAFVLGHRYEALPALSGRITEEGLRVLDASGQIAAIQLDRLGVGHLGQSVPALHADILHADYGLSGAGVTVGVLDSGVDTDHPDLVDDLVAQQCFTDGNCPPYDSNTGASAEDEHGHGSHVASVITARGAVAGPGFAPDADIVAVRVLDQYNSGWVSDWVAGLDWILANQPQLRVDLLNLSLGTWALYRGNCDAEEPLLAYALARVRAEGIAVFASSGNQGMADAIAAPACNSGVIAVGATYDANLGREPDLPLESYRDWFGPYWPDCHDDNSSLETIACFGNSGEMLDLLAPGARITGAGLEGDRWFFYGTSQAAPTAAGIAALMLEADADLAPATIELMLKQSGQSLTDPRNGRAIPAVDALAAVRPLLPVAPTGITLSGVDRTSTGIPNSFTAAVTPLSSTQPLRYYWQASALPDQIASDGLTNTASFTWPQAGTYTVKVTATNDGGQVATAQKVTVTAVALTGATVTSPPEAATGAPYSLQAAVQPPTASWPIVYEWLAAGQESQIHRGGTQDEATFTWDLPGQYTVTLVASNPLSAVTRTHPVSVAVVAPEEVLIAGPKQGASGMPITLTAAPAPTPLSRPLTYTWWATDLLTQTLTGGPESTASFTWETPGIKEVGVRVENAGGSVRTVRQIIIREVRPIYFPLLHRE